MPLINRAVGLLDGISAELKKIDIVRLRTEKEYFERLYLTLKDNLDKLRELKDEMEARGFDSPYFALGMHMPPRPYPRHGYRREDVEDQRDTARHKKIFIADASFKRGTFERAKSSIATHNIAIGHLEEFVSIECDCGRILKGKEATKILEESRHFECPKCHSRGVKMAENEQGVYRLELIPYLPFGGENTLEISNFTPIERIAYRELTRILREKKKGKIKSAMVIFKVAKGGRWIKKRELVALDKKTGLDCEGILRDKYGKIMIEKIRFHHERSILISGKYNRQALSIGYTKILKEKRVEIIDFLLGKRIDVEKLRLYEKLKRDLDSMIQSTRDITTPIDVRIDDEKRELIDEFEDKLKSLGLMNKRGDLDPELEEAIAYRQELRKKILSKIPAVLFAWDVFRFLLVKPYRERRYASIFPGLQPIPEEDQLENALIILADTNLISIIDKFIDESATEIENASDVIFKKFEIEEILKDYLKVTSSRAVGGVALYINSDLQLDRVSEIVSSDLEELKEVMKILVRLGRREVIPEERLEGLEEIQEIEISERAKAFLELVR
ncbi:MAG: DUF530 family protein [Candidatus Hydrothermarchaeales archaeon]